MLDKWGAWKFVKPGDVVLDIGTYHGKTAAMYLAEGGLVHGFEPLARNRSKIPSEISSHPGFTLHPYALSDRSGQRDLFVPRRNDGASSLSRAFFEGIKGDASDPGEVHVVDVRTLDDLDLPQAKFWKIDVEGSELEVLRGADRTLRHKPPEVLQVEIMWRLQHSMYWDTLNLMKTFFAHVWAIGAHENGKLVCHRVTNEAVRSQEFHRDLMRAGTPHYYASLRDVKELLAD